MSEQQTVLLVGGTGRTGRRVLQRHALHEGLVSSIFAPDDTSMNSVARAMCELLTNPEAWKVWKGKMPVIINTPPSRS